MRLDSPAAAGAGSPAPAAEFTVQHLLVDPGTWEELDPMKRRWFFVQAGAAALGVVEALRTDHGDLAWQRRSRTAANWTVPPITPPPRWRSSHEPGMLLTFAGWRRCISGSARRARVRGAA